MQHFDFIFNDHVMCPSCKWESNCIFLCISKMVGYTVIQIKILPEGLGASETPSADATWRGGRPELLGFFPWPWLPGRFFSVPSQNTCSVFFFLIRTFLFQLVCYWFVCTKIVLVRNNFFFTVDGSEIR